MHVTIKNYEAKEAEQVEKLLKLCNEDRSLLNVLSSLGLKFAYSAIVNKELIGITFAWKSSFHPNCTYFRILANPFYNILDIEEKLLAKVIERKKETCPLQTSLWEASVTLNSVYKSNGFKEIRRTYMPKLKVTSVSNDIFCDKYIIKTLNGILPNETLTEQLILLVKRIYEETHAVNPVAEMTIAKWRELILADDVITAGSYICIDEDEKNILAYSFLHDSDEKDAFDLGWCGASKTEQIEMIPQLVLHQIKYAIEQNIQFLNGEFDTTDPYAMKVLESFPFEPAPSWITVQKESMKI